MKRSSVISFIFWVNCLSALQLAYGKNDKTASKRGEAQAFLRAGKLSTKHKHECSWEIVGDTTVSLLVTCTVPSSSTYNCTYEGEPQKCPLYATKAKQYWKQIFGKFKKMKNVCEEKTLKSRLCKKTEAVESQLLKLGGEVLVDKAKGKIRTKEPGKVPEGREKDPEGNENVGAEKKSGTKKRKPDTKSNLKPIPSPSPSGLDLTTVQEVNDDIVELNENLAEAYCAEKWHSLCSFFVNFWNG
ncbi:fibroblast growth factor-binding protein 3 [Hyla sarda]|uniref:fibroblast growth factor-binding protein 3 n=1 Tax=Hyla sarda TaxID=327740 RepID=UPI0024C2F796|nr:fibroblast growth factor-binding protein 3 [Hyla sarda]XP_056385403.1 fibroblast growth factor-binding protein 3 [Hyla sarda]